MTTPYQESSSAIKYLDFLNSTNGKIQVEVLFKAIKNVLPQEKNIKILDAGCGPGWLAGGLKQEGYQVEACDESEFLLRFAKTHNKGINFQLASLDKTLPYPPNTFDVVILNMVGPDLENLNSVMKNLSGQLKLNGKLLMSAPNPKYTFPAAEWKRSIVDVLTGRKPKLKLNPSVQTGKIKREFSRGAKIDSFYYQLSDYLKAANEAGLSLLRNQEIHSSTDSKNFDLNYQLYRYPLLLLLEFKK